MNNANETQSPAVKPRAKPMNLKRWLWRLWHINESLRGYVLLLPVLLFMFFMLMVALVTLVVQSFWADTSPGAAVQYTLANYSLLLTPQGEIYRALLLRSLWMSLLITVSVILFCYPVAYLLAFHIRRRKIFWLVVITLPFWASYLLRVFSWKVILQHDGVLNSMLMALGFIDQPLDIFLHNRSAVIVTLTHAWAAFAILPIYVSLEKIDRSMLEAASDLGDGFMRRFWRITLPLSMPGVLGAVLLLFIRNVGDYVTPALVGGVSGTMLGNIIVSLFTEMGNEPLAAAVSIAMMVSITLIVCVFVLLIGGRKRLEGVT
jgi:spermidine/putrescine transport system permease protein|tara:strand:+ start:1506 stop:2459 length:954 start_codon:yes stop_codon:yes gene_type:complete